MTLMQKFTYLIWMSQLMVDIKISVPNLYVYKADLLYWCTDTWISDSLKHRIPQRHLSLPPCVFENWLWHCMTLELVEWSVIEDVICDDYLNNHTQSGTIGLCIWLDFFPSIWLCTLQHCESALKWEPACYCTWSVPVMLSGPHFWVLFVVCQFLTVSDCSEAISLNLQFKLGPLQPDYKSTFCALRSSQHWMVDISNHSAVNPSVR